ncbi:MAG: hypothetical protein PHV16_03145 [Candidatus Nanoarchaeia archaeon]|nr:hypothetical protein [Candidatus Nanoarchaeia archaeon]
MIDKTKIKKQIEKVMHDFIKELNKAEGVKQDFGSERDKSTRDVIKKDQDKDFRKLMFENAPKKNQDFILMEKKHW